MASIDDFFSGTTDEFSHPSLRDWKRRLTNGASARLELYRPPATLGLSRTKMFVHFIDKDGQASIDEADWDEYLNQGLIRLGVPAVDAEQESDRFALGLRDGLRTVEKEFGNGYFNAVLLDLVVESKLDEYPEIAEILKFTYHDGTERGTRSYERCRDAIALAISARAKELDKEHGGPLAYSRDEAKRILARAIAKYLDERFSVTNRRQLGLLS